MGGLLSPPVNTPQIGLCIAELYLWCCMFFSISTTSWALACAKFWLIHHFPGNAHAFIHTFALPQKCPVAIFTHCSIDVPDISKNFSHCWIQVWVPLGLGQHEHRKMFPESAEFSHFCPFPSTSLCNFVAYLVPRCGQRNNGQSLHYTLHLVVLVAAYAYVPVEKNMSWPSTWMWGKWLLFDICNRWLMNRWYLKLTRYMYAIWMNDMSCWTVEGIWVVMQGVLIECMSIFWNCTTTNLSLSFLFRCYTFLHWQTSLRRRSARLQIFVLKWIQYWYGHHVGFNLRVDLDRNRLGFIARVR